ncbi:hypothetical protein FRC08_008845 [Ceratobasidium sp. 394]|nr:hypothetical protein FRC08_008845 [Ceratobasidium sp. 394]
MLQKDQKGFATEGITWMTILLTQSTTLIHLHKIGTVSALGLSVALNTIINSRARVQSLSLPDVLRTTEGKDGEHHLLNLLPNRPVPESLLALSNIHILEVGLWIFRSELFQSLGNLPRLEYLKLYSRSTATGPLEPVSLHEDSFPALKRLCLNDLSWSHIEAVLKHRSLVKNIVSLKFIADDNDKDTWNQAESALLTLKSITNLTDLDIGFDEGDCYEIHLGNALLDVLSQLPLHTLKMTHALFSGTSGLDFHQVFPLLTELRIPDHMGELNDFLEFAMIPNLRLLATTPSDFTIIDQTISGDLPACSSLDTLEFTSFWTFDFPVKHVHTIAKYLLKLFPNLKKISWIEDRGEAEGHQHLVLLSAHIELLRERNDARARIAEQYGWDAADRLLPDDKQLLRPRL